MAKTTSSETLLTTAQSWQRRLFRERKGAISIGFGGPGNTCFSFIHIILHAEGSDQYDGFYSLLDDHDCTEELQRLNDFCNNIVNA